MRSKHRPLPQWLLRLRCCWRLLTARSWLFYLPDGNAGSTNYYKTEWHRLTLSDTANLRQWCAQQEADLHAGQHLLDSALNLNPGIAPAPDQ